MTKLLQRRDTKAIGMLLETLQKPAADATFKKYMRLIVAPPEQMTCLAAYLQILSQGKSATAVEKR